jgi:thiamine biosynthesis lipoprotein
VAAVDAAVAAAEETHGLVDPTLGLSLQALGYDRDFDQVVAHQAGLTATAIPIPAVVDAWNAIEMDPAGRIKVPFGVALDLGATGKAFASDLIATTIATELGVDCLVCLGGDIRIGQSEPDETEDEAREWLIDVHEDADEPALETVTLWRGAMATSSTIGRKWTRAGQAMHHVLDPRTGQPIPQIWRTISVAADTCADANMATTMSLILGAAAPEWLTERAFPARLTALDGSVTYLPGWPEHPTDDQEH